MFNMWRKPKCDRPAVRRYGCYAAIGPLLSGGGVKRLINYVYDYMFIFKVFHSYALWDSHFYGHDSSVCLSSEAEYEEGRRSDVNEAYRTRRPVN